MAKKWLILICYFLIGIVIGSTIAVGAILLFTDETFAEIKTNIQQMNILYAIGSGLLSLVLFFCAVGLQIILHEGGHLVCGILSGYHFVSFRVGPWILIRKNKKFQLKHYALAGTGGQCLLTPPDKPLEEIPFTAYNAGGIIANILFSLIALAGFFFTDQVFAEVFFLFTAAIGGVFALLNGIPMNGNDGGNIRLLKKDRNALRHMVNQLKINAAIQDGQTLDDIPQEWMKPNETINFRSPIEVSTRIMEASALLLKGEAEEAHLMFEELISKSEGLIPLLQKEISCELIVSSLLTGRMERAKELYTEKLAADIKAYRKIMSSKERLLFTKALLEEKDRVQAENIYRELVNHQNQYLMQGEVKMDIAFMENLLKQTYGKSSE